MRDRETERQRDRERQRDHLKMDEQICEVEEEADFDPSANPVDEENEEVEEIVGMDDDYDYHWFGFEVHSSKAKEWCESDAQVQAIPCDQSQDDLKCTPPRRRNGVIQMHKCKPSLVINHKIIVWFDVEKDDAGSIQCLKFLSEIGVCDGKLSYIEMTEEGNIEVWLLKSKSGDYDGGEFEWLKRCNLSLEEVFGEKWNVVSKFFWTRKTRTPTKAAKFSTKMCSICPLPYLDGEVVWFWMGFDYKEYCRNKLFFVNIRRRELKLFDGILCVERVFGAKWECGD
ncbi:hypothetical protein Sjap_005463 [Stephania japonica]|uniref:Uncharacterized protein n=1 Tax=Stephania japonica TaxID=461633 RepID=A0AAP0K6J7_9MAGN